MRVFVAGATGAIGRPLVAALTRAGHIVVGLRTDAMDAAGVEAAMQSFLPEVVIDELTSLPKRNTPEEMSAAAERNRRLRLEGGRNVQNAARAVGARRYIVQSCGFWYAPGDGLAVETDSLAFDGSPSIAAGTRTYAEIEQRVLEQPDMEGVALRYGFFYGPGTWYHREGAAADRARAQQLPLIGAGQGVWSFVHVEDAAAATVAALHCAPGVYKVVDDHPSPMSVWLPAFARAVDAPPPLALAAAGEDAVYYATRLRGASNAKAKNQLDFGSRPLEWLRGSCAGF
jgi:nucleoside-diphosphate-sugar epimerase